MLFQFLFSYIKLRVMVTTSGHLIKKKILSKTEFPSGRIYGFDLFPKINLLAAKIYSA